MTNINLQNKIYEIRGQKVMLDTDLAVLYEVETKYLNLTVKRNIKRFPEDFMFQLTKDEWRHISNLRNQAVKNQRLQFATFENRKSIYTKYLPFAFTEQGLAMLSGILNSFKRT